METKTSDSSVLTIGEIVAKNHKTAEIFSKYGIDYCCGGKIGLEEACHRKGINVLQIKTELESVILLAVPESQDFNSWDLDFLCDYIVNTHHKYISAAIPVIHEYTQKVARVHGGRHPEVIEIANIFVQVIDEINHHMMKEENILFPYIRQMAQAKKVKTHLSRSPFGTVENPVRMMEHEHDIVGDLLKKISELSENYTPPADGCTTFRLSYLKLQEFENDLHQHIHLENNILFPKAVEMEKDLM